MILLSISLSAQQSEIEYNSDTGAAGPHLLIQESGDAGDGSMSGDDGWARIWFKNTADASNRWGFLARPHDMAKDNDEILNSPLVMAYTGVQKFGFGKDGTLRINKQYILPNMDGMQDQVLTTDGSGNVTWADPGTGASSLWTETIPDIYRTSGNVGIGNNSPLDKLHITAPSQFAPANIRLEADIAKNIKFYEGATETGSIGHNGVHLNIVNEETSGNITLDAENDVRFFVEGNTTAAPNMEVKGSSSNQSSTLSLRSSLGQSISFITNPSITSQISSTDQKFAITQSIGTNGMEFNSKEDINFSTEGFNGQALKLSDNKATVGIFSEPTQVLDVRGKIRVSDDGLAGNAGAIRYLNGKFEGHNGAHWIPLSSPKTITQAISAQDLNPGEDAAAYNSSTIFSYFSSGGSPELNYTLPIPVGGTIKKVSMIFSDNGIGNGTNAGIKMELYRNRTVAGTGLSPINLGNVNSFDTGGINNYAKVNITVTDTLGTDECYFVRIYADNGSGFPGSWPTTAAALKISKITVDYEMP